MPGGSGDVSLESMNRFHMKDLPLGGLKLIRFDPLKDRRGSLTRLFCAEELGSLWAETVVQANHTHTLLPGTIRGLHFQRPPRAEKKLVVCLRGKVWDVAVDLRKGSPTFLRWHGEVLSAANHQAILIPEGFAHGFQTLSPDVEMVYFHSAPHVAEAEGGIRPSDPRLEIAWPQPVTEISDRDGCHPLLDPGFTGLIP